MRTIKVNKGQNIFDVALSHYGAVEAVLQLWRDNEVHIFSDEVESMQLDIDNAKIVNQEVVDNYLENGLVNTGSQLAEVQTEGIFDETFDETFE
jgi:hypothetical protein